MEWIHDSEGGMELEGRNEIRWEWQGGEGVDGMRWEGRDGRDVGDGQEGRDGIEREGWDEMGEN